MIERSSNWQTGVLAAGTVLIAGGVGSLATVPNIPDWYAHLNKPAFTPPNWIFGPVWTVLYALMAISLWMVLSQPRHTPGRTFAISAFFAQIALNAFWSVAFFGLHSPSMALVVISLLILILLLTIWRFWVLEWKAGVLLLPYLAWTSFAAVLNFSLYNLNP